MKHVMRRVSSMVLELGILVYSSNTTAQATPAHIEVFTLSSLPITRAGTSEIHIVDALQALKKELGRALPPTSDQAQRIVLGRMQQGGKTLNERTRRAAIALTRAAQLGIDRVPAIVFDHQWVVYGILDLQEASQIYAWQRDIGPKKRIP